MNIKLLKSKMVLAGDTQKELAEHLSICPLALSNKMLGKAQFKANEIAKIVWKYDLTAQETHDIFFKKGVEVIDESECS